MFTLTKDGEEGTLGQVIKKIRIRKGLKLKDVAGKVGITESALSKYENDKRRPSYAMLMKILRALDAELYIMHD